MTAGRDQYELTQYPYLNIGPEDYMANSGTGSEYTSNSVLGVLFTAMPTVIFFRQIYVMMVLPVLQVNIDGGHFLHSLPVG